LDEIKSISFFQNLKLIKSHRFKLTPPKSAATFLLYLNSYQLLQNNKTPRQSYACHPPHGGEF